MHLTAVADNDNAGCWLSKRRRSRMLLCKLERRDKAERQAATTDSGDDPSAADDAIVALWNGRRLLRYNSYLRQ